MVQCARNDCRRRLPSALVAGFSLGAVVDGQWFCSTRCVEAVVRAVVGELLHPRSVGDPAGRAVRLGALLASQVGLSQDLVASVLADADPSREPIGQRLRRLGLITTDDLLRALATQAGVRYLASVDPAAVAHRHGHLAEETVRALRIVPVATDQRRQALQVACTAPIPRQAVRALGRITNCAVEPMLVADEALPGLVDLYASAASRNGTVVGRLCIADAGPRVIATSARQQRVVRVLYERCDPYVWVRLDGEQRTIDVLLREHGSRGN